MARLYGGQHIEGLGKIFSIDDELLDVSLKALEKEGARMISARDLAYAQMRMGKRSDLHSGSYVREGAIYIPHKGTKLVRNSPILYDAREAVKCHAGRTDYQISRKTAENALLESISLPPGQTLISTDRFKENEITSFLFEDLAEDYGRFLRWQMELNGIKIMNTMSRDYTENLDSYKKPIAMQVTLSSIYSDPQLGFLRALHLPYFMPVRGVKPL